MLYPQGTRKPSPPSLPIIKKLVKPILWVYFAALTRHVLAQPLFLSAFALLNLLYIVEFLSGKFHTRWPPEWQAKLAFARLLNRSLLISLLVSLQLAAFVFQFYQVRQDSMFPTYRSGQLVIIEKLSLGLLWPWSGLSASPFLARRSPAFRPLQAGDVVVLIIPGPNGQNRAIKRILACPGDQVSFSPGGKLLVNNSSPDMAIFSRQLPTFLPLGQPAGRLSAQTRVPAKMYLLLGDNRLNSQDSRHFGLVPAENILGRVIPLPAGLQQFFGGA